MSKRIGMIFAPRGWIGLVLVGVFWALNWGLSGVRTAYLFFPLWLGYALTMDALVEWRRGSSIWKRSPSMFVLLFVLSIPAWWLFEWINHRLGNWEYLGGERFSTLEYNILSTISFSTVMPAVFETAEFVRSFRWVERCASGPRIAPYKSILIIIGIAMFGMMLLWPRECYPLAWTSLVFILEPINLSLGRSTLLGRLTRGDWRPAISLAAGALMCGFFWEMWNYYSYPKWVYHTPGVEFAHLFEMPALGYLGYLPFGWELYGLKNFLWPKGADLQI